MACLPSSWPCSYGSIFGLSEVHRGVGKRCPLTMHAAPILPAWGATSTVQPGESCREGRGDWDQWSSLCAWAPCRPLYELSRFSQAGAENASRPSCQDEPRAWVPWLIRAATFRPGVVGFLLQPLLAPHMRGPTSDFTRELPRWEAHVMLFIPPWKLLL